MTCSGRIPVVVLLAALLIDALPAAAQQAPEPPPRREGSAELSFVGTSGNASTTSVGVGGALTYRPDGWELASRVAYVRNDSAGALTAEAFDGSLRAGHDINARLSVFSRYGYLRDRFAGIAHRHSVEGGVSALLAQEAPHRLTVNGGVGYARERRTAAPHLSTAMIPVGAAYTLTLSDSAEIGNELGAVFSLSEAADRRVTNVAAVTAKLTTRLSLKVSNTARFVNQPAPGFERLDTTTAIALVATF